MLLPTLSSVLQQHQPPAVFKNAPHLSDSHVGLVIAADAKSIHDGIKSFILVGHLAGRTQPKVHLVLQKVSLLLKRVACPFFAEDGGPRPIDKVRDRTAVSLLELQRVDLVPLLLEHLLAILELM